MSDEVAMPILKRLSRNLPPLEEDADRNSGSSSSLSQQKSNGSGVTKQSLKTTTTVSSVRSSSDVATLVMDIGQAILTARTCYDDSDATHSRDKGVEVKGVSPHQPSLREEPEPLPSLIHSLWSQGLPVCIEVRGQMKEVHEDPPTLLLERWGIQLVAKRAPLSSAPSSPQLLLQAIHSHLHFSQIRSWQEVGGTTCHSSLTPLPFQLVYRVCALKDSSGGFSPYVPHYHSFPPLPLSSHSVLLVSTTSLPRLSCIPQQLLPQVSTENLVHTREPSWGQSSKGQSTERKSLPKDLMLSSAQMACLARDSMREGFPFSPPLPSPLSPKLLVGLADKLTFDHLHISEDIGDKTVSSLEKELEAFHLDSEVTSPFKAAADSGTGVVNWSNGQAGLVPPPVNSSGRQTGVVPPTASSPVPSSYMGGMKRRSCAITCRRPRTRVPPQRCNSAPVFIPSLCLLGTFEESVLNGRLEPCGQVEGFTVEVAASGSFCPPHLVLPVNAAFYSLDDNHGGTSPYLGQVDLSGVGKRGYQVPRKGTVQVTLFNPNHMVVKIYIVTYDFSDMPPLTQTFLRQKTLSRPHHLAGQGATPTTYLPALHYLIHLRFLCSKSKRIYLHRDIRMIFARRAPDTTDPDHSKVSLYTRTEGPNQPKYSPSTITARAISTSSTTSVSSRRTS